MKSRMHRIATLISSALVVSVSFCASASSSADHYPERPVRMIVPFGPGSTPDVLTRDLAGRLSKELGQNFVVENISGASGMVGTQAVARSRPDGYTLLSGTVGILSVNQFLYDKIPYDIEEDFTSVSLFTTNPNVLAVPADSPFSSVQDLVGAAKAAPDSLNYGSSGNGTSLHLAAELLKDAAGISVAHIPYTKGVMQDLAAGRLDFVFYHISGTVPLVDAGKVKILAVATPERFPLLPDVPTFKEEGFDNFDVSGWMGIMAPAGTPPEIIVKLEKAIGKVTSDPQWRESLTRQGIVVVGSGPQQLDEFTKAERAKWGRLIQSNRIRLEQ
ncbi:Bug family tripartite tricarboxylate transporter substrate binding protein [Orrella marina]|nr:tripartite tricarboxylate transporter substrate binding protein [Orrella marina]